MGCKTTTSPNGPRSRHHDERDEGEGEDTRKPPPEVVEKEGTIKEETRCGNPVRDGDFKHPAGEGDQDSRRALIVIILEFCITYLPDTYIFCQAPSHDSDDFRAHLLGWQWYGDQPRSTASRRSWIFRSIAVQRHGFNYKPMATPCGGKCVLLSLPRPSTPSHPQVSPRWLVVVSHEIIPTKPC